MVTQDRFATGQTYKDFLKDANEQLDLYQHHYNKTNISADDEHILYSLSNRLNILVITEARCPDSAVVLPVLQKWTENNENITLKVLTRDDNLDIMNSYLTNGAQAIPKMVIFDHKFNELGTWGPRPAHIQEYFERFRSQIKSGEIDKVEVHKKMRQMYAKDKGKSTIKEIKSLLIKSNATASL